MRRRAFAFAVAGFFSPGPIAFAQTARLARIGWLGLARDSDASSSYPALAGLRTGLRERGWVEGRNLVIEARFGAIDNAKDMVAELLQAKVDLIVAETSMIFRARSHAGSTPLLFHINGDPVQAGLVESYARPGGTMTGVTNLSAEMSAKRVEMLKKALPHMTRCAAVANQGHPGWQVESEATRIAADRLKVNLTWLPVYTANDFAAAFDAVVRSGAQGLIAVPDNLIFNQAKSIAEFCMKQRIPAISGSSAFADAGNLMGYGPTAAEVYVKLGGFADKVLRGVKPAELPVENPTRFEMVLNLKVARALNLSIPQTILLLADRFIE